MAKREPGTLFQFKGFGFQKKVEAVTHTKLTRIPFFFCSHFGHDKSLEIRPYGNLPAEERPILLYAGDGVSDLSAAKETDLLFAKAGRGKLLPLKPLFHPLAQSPFLLKSLPQTS